MNIKSLKQLTKKHIDVYMDLVADKIEPKKAIEINNAFGKIINSCRVQVDVAKYNKTKPNLDF